MLNSHQQVVGNTDQTFPESERILRVCKLKELLAAHLLDLQVPATKPSFGF